MNAREEIEDGSRWIEDLAKACHELSEKIESENERLRAELAALKEARG